MIFHKIDFENFRQFYGKQSLTFSNDKKRNITVVHGENGSGKTTILNAFSWAFYNEVDFENDKKILNERKIDEIEVGDTASIKVTITFEDNGSRFIFKREQKEEKIDDKTTSLRDESIECIEIDSSGKSKIKHNPGDFINQILPKRMYPYFFFNGERIDKLAKNESTNEISEAIKNIMGLEIIERSLNHLSGNVKKIFKSDLSQYGTVEVKEKLAEQEKLEEQKIVIINDIEKIKANKRGFIKEQDEVLNKLRQLKDAKEFQEKRDELIEKRKAIIAKSIETEKRIKKEISAWAFCAFAGKMIDECEKIVKEKRKLGEIPSGIKRQFVEDLIKRGYCICKTPLIVGKNELSNVQEWIKRSSSQEIENIFIEVAGAIKLIRAKRTEIFHDIEDFLKAKKEDRYNIKIIDEKLSEISAKLSNKMSEEITDLEEKNKKIAGKISDCDYELGAKEKSELKSVIENINDLDKEIRDLKIEEDNFKVASKRLEVCEELIKLFQKIYDFISKKIKEKVSYQVDEVFRKIIKKEYWAEINDEYELGIFKKVGNTKIPVAKSTGENQISSLAFIGGLADIARRQYENRENTFFRGGIYPLIMDSPFGQLDPEYRELVAKNIPELAPQIILLVSESQWKGEVSKGMQENIGVEAHIIIYTPNPEKKKIENKSKIVQSQKYEYCIIEEVANER